MLTRKRHPHPGAAGGMLKLFLLWTAVCWVLLIAITLGTSAAMGGTMWNTFRSRLLAVSTARQAAENPGFARTLSDSRLIETVHLTGSSVPPTEIDMAVIGSLPHPLLASLQLGKAAVPSDEGPWMSSRLLSRELQCQACTAV